MAIRPTIQLIFSFFLFRTGDTDLVTTEIFRRKASKVPILT